MGRRAQAVPRALRKGVIHLSSGVTCIGSSVSSTVHTVVLSRRSVPIRLHHALKFAAERHLSRLVRSVVDGDVKESSVVVSSRATRTLQSLHLFVFRRMCQGPITGNRRMGTGTVLRRVCCFCVSRVRRLPTGLLGVLSRNRSGKHVIYSCVSNVASGCTVAGFGRGFVPRT